MRTVFIVFVLGAAGCASTAALDWFKFGAALGSCIAADVAPLIPKGNSDAGAPTVQDSGAAE